MEPSLAPTANPPRLKLEFVDTLRGFAALYVFLYHLALLPNPHPILPDWAKKVILTGGTGVTLFFVVSAFTLCLSMRTRKEERHPTANFYIRRFFRIAPLFYLWVAITCLRDWFYFHATHSWQDIGLSTSFLFNFIPGKHLGFVWTSWTLGVEMVFYAFFPLLFRWINTLFKAVAFFGASLLISFGWSAFVKTWSLTETLKNDYIHFSFLNTLPIFSFGIVVFFIFERFIQGRGRNRLVGSVLIATALGLYALFINGRLPGWLGWLGGYHIQAVIYGIFLLGLACCPVVFLVNRATRFFGKISYSIYLNHTNIVFFMAPVYAWVYRHSLPTTLQFAACAGMTLALITTASWFTYRFVEEPGMRYGGRIIQTQESEQRPSPGFLLPLWVAHIGRFARQYPFACISAIVLLLGGGARSYYKANKRWIKHAFTHRSERSAEFLRRLASVPQNEVKGRIESFAIDGRAMPITSGTILVAAGSTVEIAGWAFDEKGDRAPSASSLCLFGRTTQSVHSWESYPVRRPDVSAYFKNSKAALESGFKVRFKTLNEWRPDTFDIALLYRIGEDDRSRSFPIALKVSSAGDR